MEAVTNGRAPPFPIIVGVAGHRDIVPEAEADLRVAVRAVLIGLRARFGEALHLMSSLTDGADQLVADVAEHLDEEGTGAPVKLIGVSPLPFAAYRERTANKAKLDHHWARATLRLELPDLCTPSASDHHDIRYEQLGVLLSRRSHLLLALWDGLAPGEAPNVRRGGVAAVARMRREGEEALAGFSDSLLFPNGVSRLDVSPRGPLLHIVAPRVRAAGAVQVPGCADAKTGDCFLLEGAGEDSGAAPKPVAPGEVFDGLSEAARHDFDQLLTLNGQIARFRGFDARMFDKQVGYLTVRDVAEPAGPPGVHLHRLRQWQAAADTACQVFQRRLHGELTPEGSPAAMIKRGWAVVRDARRPPHLGIVFGYAVLVPVAVLLFETYAHLMHSPVVLGLYLSVFAGGAAYYHFRVRRHELQNRFQDYRALAEAMRVQLFWAAAATPEAASDNYLRKQGGELGWIQFALRGPALWSMAAALALGKPCRELVTRGWIEDQIQFFGNPGAGHGKAAKHAEAAERGGRWARRFLATGLAFSASLALIEAAKLIVGPHGRMLGVDLGGVIEAREWMLVMAATAPALAAFFSLWVELRAYEAQAHSYGLMGRIFRRARQVTTGVDDTSFQAVVRDLGREALAENAEWLLDHRRRKIEQKS